MYYSLFIAIFLIFTACSSSIEQNSIANTPPIWQIQGCKLKGDQNHIHLTTNGKIEQDKIYFKIQSDLVLTNIDVDTTAPKSTTAIEGYNDNFSFELYYTPDRVAQLIKDYGVLVINYQPVGSAYEYKAVFPTQAMVELITKLTSSSYAKSCW